LSQQINLYSPLFRKQKKVFSAVAIAQAIGLVVLVIAVFYFYVAGQTSLLEIRAVDSGRQLQSDLERLKVSASRESPEARAKTLSERKSKLEAVLAERAQALQAMESGAAPGRTEGYASVLRALARLSMDGVWLTRVRFSDESGVASIAGRALRAGLIPVYLERLRAEERLRGREFASLEITRQAAPAAQGESAAAPQAGSFVEFVLSTKEAEARK
jgi:hypothetical protein